MTYLLLRPSKEEDKVTGFLLFIFSDKVIHGITFLILTLLAIISYLKTKPIVFLLLFSSYGVLIEYIQKYMNVGRSFDYFDMLSDFIGCLLALFIAKIFFERKTPE